MRNNDRFMKNMLGLGEVFGKEITDRLADVYWLACAELSDDEFALACTQAARGLRFFPKPAELLESARGDPEARALEAWGQLQQAIVRHGHWESVMFADPKITRVVKLLGGWLEVCNWQNGEVQYRRHEFLAAYKALSEGGEVEVLAGQLEMDNTAKGLLGYVPEPVVIGGPVARPALPGQPEGRRLIQELAGLVGADEPREADELQADQPAEA